MARGWWFRFSFLAALTIVALMSVAPTAFNLTEKSSFPMKSKINLGLDLQGGLYMVLGIDFNKVYRDEVIGNGRKMVNLLKEETIEAKIGDLVSSDAKDPKQAIVLTKATDVDRAKDILSKYFGNTIRLTGEDNGTLTYGLSRDFVKEVEDTALSKSIEVIRNRIDVLKTSLVKQQN